MNKFIFLYLFLLCLFISCDSEVDEDVVRDVDYGVRDVEYGIPYEDTSTLVKTYSNITDSTIHIGNNSFIIPKYNVFPKESVFRPFFFYPIITYTNKGSLLVVCTNSELYDDNGEMDILLARKEKESNSWEIKKIFPTDIVKGRAMCPALVVDRNTGRIYLFVNYFKNIYVNGDKHIKDEVGHVYKYSDDDGATWSKEYDMKQAWNTFSSQSYFFYLFNDQSNKSTSLWYNDLNNRDGVHANNDNVIYINSGPNGISLEDGTLLVPSCVIIQGIWRSALLIREKGLWHYSRPTPNLGDTECTVYLDNDDHIVVDCRTEKTTRRKYIYNITNDEFIEINPSEIDSYVRVSTEIVNDNGLYYMCLPDSPNNERKDITFWGSKDGIKWQKIFLVNPSPSSGYGYTSITIKDNKLFISYEAPEGIFVLDISSCRDIIRDQIMN